MVTSFGGDVTRNGARSASAAAKVVDARSNRWIGPRMVAAPMTHQVRRRGDADHDVPIIRGLGRADPHRPSVGGNLVHHAERRGGVEVGVDEVEAILEAVLELNDPEPEEGAAES